MKYPTHRTPPSRRHRSNPAHIDLLPGGRADEYRPRDFNRQQLHSGSRVEREHTRDRTLAQEIAMDHLVEDPAYYHRLAKFERHNPVLGPPQPVLPGLPEVWGTKDMALPMRWQDSTPMALLHAVEQRQVFEDEFAEMEALVEDVGYRGAHEAAERHGTSVKMAAELAGGLYDTLVEVAEEKSEALVEAFVSFFRAQADAESDYRRDQAHEYYVDYFLADPNEHTCRNYANEIWDQVQDAFREQHPDAPELTLEVLADVLSDPDMYDVEAQVQGSPAPGLAVDSFEEEYVETQVSWRWSGERRSDFQQLLESMTDSEVADAVGKLENDDPYFSFRPWMRSSVDKAFFLNNDSSEARFTVDLTVYWVVSLQKVLAALAAREPEEDAESALPQQDNIVYQYPGTHDTVAGASARGMYVALLRPEQLRQEGADLGICVGRQDMGYRDQVIDGTLDIYSIRTESGRPKFTISVYRRPRQVSQVKGKANRLPGFAAGGAVFSKEDEVRLVIEFLMSLGIHPADIERVFDLKAGLAGLRALGQDPFAPKPVRALPRGNGTRREVAYWAKKAYSVPMGGKWGV